jgi:hypothetical protein
MPPEVFGRLAYDASADMFSFTLLLWEMLTLDKPHYWNTVDPHDNKQYV